MSQLPPVRRITLPPHIGPDGSAEAPIALDVYEGGTGPAVVFSHGFPELAHSWRHQYQPLVDAGYRVIIPDQRGYAGSDAPEEIERYDIDHLTGDLVGLLDALEIERAVFVGHDWGGFVTWAMPLLHPDRTAGVIGVNTPYTARTPLPPTQVMRAMTGGEDTKLYILWFQQPGVAEAVMDEVVELTFDRLLRTPPTPAEAIALIAESGGSMNPFIRMHEMEARGEPLVTRDELAVYVDAFTRSGFRGGINWYRNFDRNWERHPEIGSETIHVPSLMVTAEWDLALPPAMAVDMPSRCSDLETVMIEKCGHWTQQEHPEELNRILIDWLGRRFR